MFVSFSGMECRVPGQKLDHNQTDSRAPGNRTTTTQASQHPGIQQLLGALQQKTAQGLPNNSSMLDTTPLKKQICKNKWVSEFDDMHPTLKKLLAPLREQSNGQTKLLVHPKSTNKFPTCPRFQTSGGCAGTI